MTFARRDIRMATVALGLIGSVAAASAAAPAAGTGFDRDKAARALGYASELFASGRCPDQKEAANSLSDDILAYWHFSAEDTEGRTAVGRLVSQGRAQARRDARAPCGRIEASLAGLRQEVLPR